MYKFGPVQQKILLVLLSGLALGAAHSSTQYFRALKIAHAAWKEIDQRNFNRSLRRLSHQKLLVESQLSDGSFRLVLTPEGAREARRLSLLGRSIRFKKPKTWDKKWRLVLFDVPETDRVFRDVLREHLHTLEFYRLQQSVFVSPYPYEAAILELVHLYGAEAYVRVATVEMIDNEDALEQHFFPRNKNKSSR